jgi:hypothetical protein
MSCLWQKDCPGRLKVAAVVGGACSALGQEGTGGTSYGRYLHPYLRNCVAENSGS